VSSPKKNERANAHDNEERSQTHGCRSRNTDSGCHHQISDKTHLTLRQQRQHRAGDNPTGYLAASARDFAAATTSHEFLRRHYLRAHTLPRSLLNLFFNSTTNDRTHSGHIFRDYKCIDGSMERVAKVSYFFLRLAWRAAASCEGG
jgi:hypothetical protein